MKTHALQVVVVMYCAKLANALYPQKVQLPNRIGFLGIALVSLFCCCKYR